MLRLESISKTFNPGTVNETQALNKVNLSLAQGEFITVIGGNGSGKSTMLNSVAGVFPIDSGKIIVDGNDVTGLPDFKRATYLGRVFQDPMLGSAGNMTIEENLALALRRGKRRGLFQGVPKSERQQYKEALELLDLGLENRMTTKIGLLSGGQRQAITLLMATIKKPKLLLLDEHTAALDPKTAAKVLELSDMLIKRDNLTTLMVTHNMNDAIRYGDRLIMMNGGNIVFEAKGEEKKSLTVKDIIEKFSTVSAGEFGATLLG